MKKKGLLKILEKEIEVHLNLVKKFFKPELLRKLIDISCLIVRCIKESNKILIIYHFISLLIELEF